MYWSTLLRGISRGFTSTTSTWNIGGLQSWSGVEASGENSCPHIPHDRGFSNCRAMLCNCGNPKDVLMGPNGLRGLRLVTGATHSLGRSGVSPWNS